MYWVDQICDEIEQLYAEKIKSGQSLIIRDEKTCSGRVHVGSLRGIAVHGIMEQILIERGRDAKFLFEINDFDPMDDVPPEHEKEFTQYLGQPLYSVPSPDGKAKNFAEMYAEEFIGVVEHIGFNAQFYRLHDEYKSGKFNEAIRTCLEHANDIRKIYKEVAESEKPNDWMPLQVACPKCGKIGTTMVFDFDGETVGFECKKNLVSWAEGCETKGRISPFDGNGKLPWKVEWAAKFKVMGVDIEGAGKDHYTKGGSRDISKRICEEILDYPNPFDIPYEFFVIGGKKMSSSKGKGASAKEVSDLLPPEITRLLLLRKQARQPVDFDPEGDTIPNLFDTFDRMADLYFKPHEGKEDFARIFEVSNLEKNRKKISPMFVPRFREVSFLVQMPHMDFLEKVTEMKGAELTEREIIEAKRRSEYAKKWLDLWAPEQFVFQISDELPEITRAFSEGDKKVCAEILQFFEGNSNPDGEAIHGFLHTLKEKLNISPKEIFVPIYQAFFGRDSGPKAGFLLSVLDAEFVKKRLKKVVNK